MPSAEFFARFGLYAVRGFLPPDLCAELRAEARAANQSGAMIGQDGAPVLDEDYRKTKVAHVSDASRTLVRTRLEAWKEALDRHFQVTSEGWTDPAFLVYRPGDFFAPHADRTQGEVADPVANRRVSAVVFLNAASPTPTPDTFGGGDLAFYGVFADPRYADVGLPLVAETGLLVAFPATARHAVTPVSHGERYTIVSWLSE